MQQKYKWGPNPHYHFAATKNIHPTYVQFLLDKPAYNADQVFSTLKSRSTRFFGKLDPIAIFSI